MDKVKSHDKLKKHLCKKRGVKLIVIPYTKFKNGNLKTLKSYLKKEFQRLKISPNKRLDSVKISVPKIYNDNDVSEIKKILNKEKFKLISYHRDYGMNYYSIQCEYKHKASNRSGYSIKTRQISLCKSCTLMKKGYKVKTLPK